MTICYPLIEGIDLVTYPSPARSRQARRVDSTSTRVALLLATPTFLRGYLRKADKEQLESVKLVVTGAEKLPKKVAEAFEQRFGKPVLEGYGLTETSPASNVNLPDPEASCEEDKVPARHAGAPARIGRPDAARRRHPHHRSGLPTNRCSLHEAGMIWLRGPNVFEGYLGQPEKDRRSHPRPLVPHRRHRPARRRRISLHRRQAVALFQDRWRDGAPRDR